MILGIVFICAGVLIAVYPPLLSIIVASVLILIGIGITSFSYRLKKTQRRSDDPFLDFFFRF
ncbi:MAG: hypothetical protein QME27_00420 [Syntrophaceae bacterium]|jgi:uncharacterized membrane protein|nr:hypothetical protein [Syntrophaceae bacterium]